jgi:hypothetical protein
MRRIATLTTALALFLAAGAQAADDGGPNNVVWSKTTGVNAVDQGSSVALGTFDGDHLTSTNVARAESTDCTDCRTTAVALQAVFVTSKPSNAEPVNAAIAINQGCTRCTTYAFAYQYVVSTDGSAKLTGRARKQLRRLRAEVDGIAHSDMEPAAMDARLNDLAAQFKAGIDADLKRQHEPHHGEVEQDDDAE